MKNMFVKNILTLSLLAVVSAPTVWAADTKEIKIQRNFLNLGFEEEPPFTSRKQGEWGCRPTKIETKTEDGKQVTVEVPIPLNNDEAAKWKYSYCIFDQAFVNGWKTTAKFEGAIREIELWKEGQLVSNDSNRGVKAGEGKIYAELNSTTAASLYQNVCVSEKDVLDWSFQHRARVDESEQMAFFISNEIVGINRGMGEIPINFENIPENIRYLVQTSLVSNSEIKNDGINDNVLDIDWKKYSGKGVQLSKYLGGRKSAVMGFGFKALQDKGEERGNWLDDVVLDLNPGIEFSATSSSVIETETKKYHSVDFNIVGNVKGPMKVKFIIDPNKVNNAALYRKNDQGHFKIFGLIDGKNTEIIPREEKDADGKSILRFEYTIPYDSSLKYDQGVTVKGLSIETFDNDIIDGDRVIPFELDPDQDGLAVLDLRSCGPDVFSGFQYEIKDDETDIAVTKTLKNEFLVPNQEVSYEISVENIFNIKDMSSTARNVRLKDSLLANLILDDQVELQCEVIENDKVKANCPSITSATQAAKDLFSENGLLIGDLPAKGKLKFTVSKLKISQNDTSTENYQGLVVNKAVVETESNDINPENNESITKDPYPAKNDLMNADNTGEKLFVIDNGGKALRTEPIKEQKAYFPLIIQNDAPFGQDYKLIASSTAIARMVQSDFSALDQTTISSFLSGLNVKFYPVEEGECQAGLSNSGDISQIKVSANSRASICAEIIASESVKASTDIWFAIESLQTGLGDIIKDNVTYIAQVLRQLELVNDQQAQINAGGTYVFAHRLTNNGSIAETGLSLAVKPLLEQDDFSYTLFIDHNNNGILDTGDEQVQPTTVPPNLPVGESMSLLLKVQAPATATNGMRGQAEIIVTPTKILEDILLEALTNLDTVFVGSNQLTLQKMQFKQENCTDISAEQIKAANFTLGQMSIGRHDCIIYRIQATNIGAEPLTSIVINDMYPAYTTPWTSLNNTLPMTDSGDSVTTQSDKVETKIAELKPGEKKSLYFGIKLQ